MDNFFCWIFKENYAKKIPAPLLMQGLYRKKFRANRGLAPLINLKNLKA